ncbi:MAG: F0F1 ATP synthase subunit A [Clostridiales bacterium]|nr:F0F1 ATP synthase subunit A [Candidatus Cacconaster stercorequi]
MENTANVLFSIGPLEVTKAVVSMWVIIAVIGIVSFIATRRLKDVPGPIQNAAEMAVAKLQDYFTGNMGAENARRYFPVMATFFVFIVVSNYSGLLPGAGKLFSVPTANLSTTAGLALIAFFTTHVVGVKRRGFVGYLKTFLTPFAVMLPLTLIEQLVRPLSLALRLYGNLYGEEMVTEQLGELFPLLLPLVMQVLSLLFCLIQAVVFTMLLSVYVTEAVEDEE